MRLNRLHTSNYPWKAFKLSLIIHSFINSKSFFKMSLWECKIEQFSLTSHPSVSLKGKSDVKRKGKIRLSSSWCIYTIKVKPLAQQAQNSFSSSHHKPKVFHLSFISFISPQQWRKKKKRWKKNFSRHLRKKNKELFIKESCCCWIQRKCERRKLRR